MQLPAMSTQAENLFSTVMFVVEVFTMHHGIELFVELLPHLNMPTTANAEPHTPRPLLQSALLPSIFVAYRMHGGIF